MAEVTLTSSVASNYKIIIDYTAGSGAVTIHGIKGCRTDGYDSQAYSAAGFTLHVGGNTKTIRFAKFGKNSGYVWWNADSASEGSSTAINMSWSAIGSNTYTIYVSDSPTANVNNQRFSWTVDSGSPVYTPSVTAPSVSASRTSISYSFSVTDSGGAAITSSGVDLSLTSFGNVVASGSGTSNTINGLTPNTTYYARSFAFNGSYTGYSSTYPSFRTTGNPPVITSVVEAPTIDSCTLTINVTYDTNASWAAGLVEYGTTQSYGSSTPSNIIQGLNSGTTYYYRVTITDTEGRTGTYTGSFTTLSDSKVFYSSVGGSFVKRKLYISINGDTYKLVQGNKINVI